MKKIIVILSILISTSYANEALVYCNKQISPGAGAGFVPVTDPKSPTRAAPSISYQRYVYAMPSKKLIAYIQSLNLTQKSLDLPNSSNIIYAKKLDTNEYNQLKDKIKLPEYGTSKLSSPINITNGGYLGAMCFNNQKNNVINAVLFKAIVNEKNISLNIMDSELQQESNLKDSFRIEANAVLPANNSIKYIVIFGIEHNGLIYGRLALIDFSYKK